MREAIEAIIKDLEDKQTGYDHLFADKDGYAYRDYFDGAGDGVEYALTKLREVLSQHAADNSRQATDAERNDQHSQTK